ncbi:MAG: helix-turn-helix domain-containing protein [Acidimicrobiaceae bacterium]|nr:helix-turn-helix domain-containing protein [Acidimicrobiaceae bacterium]
MRGLVEGRARLLDCTGQLLIVQFRTKRVGMMASDGIEYLGVMDRLADITATDFGVQRLYTLDEAALLLRKSTRTLRRMLRDDTLAGRKVGGTWRIPQSELERLTHPRI